MRNLFNTIEKAITTFVAVGVLSMVFRLFFHIALTHDFVWYMWLYVGLAGAMILFVSAVILTFIFQAWKQDRV